jgi:nitroreductase
MNFTELVSKRRSYRKLKPFDVKPSLIKDLIEIAKLAPSCDNNQPWRFVFIYDDKQLKAMNDIFFEQNKWVKNASLLVGVFSKQDFDCKIEDRDYYLFDTGIAVSFMMLRATEMGLVAHPTSYYNEIEAKRIMNIPQDMKLITILVIGKLEDKDKLKLTTDQETAELERPRRMSMQYLSYLNKYIDEYEDNKERLNKILEVE